MGVGEKKSEGWRGVEKKMSWWTGEGGQIGAVTICIMPLLSERDENLHRDFISYLTNTGLFFSFSAALYVFECTRFLLSGFPA